MYKHQTQKAEETVLTGQYSSAAQQLAQGLASSGQAGGVTDGGGRGWEAGEPQGRQRRVTAGRLRCCSRLTSTAQVLLPCWN